MQQQLYMQSSQTPGGGKHGCTPASTAWSCRTSDSAKHHDQRDGRVPRARVRSQGRKSGSGSSAQRDRLTFADDKLPSKWPRSAFTAQYTPKWYIRNATCRRITSDAFRSVWSDIAIGPVDSSGGARGGPAGGPAPEQPLVRPVQQVLSSPVDTWGLKALLMAIKAHSAKDDRGMLLFGEDLTELGVDVGQDGSVKLQLPLLSQY